VLDKLISDYKHGHFTYGTIVMHAKKAGWDEEAWLVKLHAWDQALAPDNSDRYLLSRMTTEEKNYPLLAKLKKQETECYFNRLKLKYICIHYFDQTAPISLDVGPVAEQKSSLLTAGELKALPQVEYLIKGILPATGISACYGASGSGKTFLVTDLGISLAIGLDWYGRKVKKCPVTFIVLEGSGGLTKRFQAWESHFNETIPDTVNVYIDTFSLMTSNDVSQLVEELNKKGQNSGLIVIDTLNQASPGADENSSKDMGLIIQNAQRLAKENNSHVMLVHHTGKDASKGLRGHSSLIAALDVAIEVRRDGSGRSWSISKSKDDTDGGVHHFELKKIILGADADGDQISSCVVEAAIQRVISSQQKRPAGAQQKIALETFNGLVVDQRLNGSNALTGVNLEQLVKAVGSNLAVEAKRKTERARAAINGLIALGLFTLKDGQVTAT